MRLIKKCFFILPENKRVDWLKGFFVCRTAIFIIGCVEVKMKQLNINFKREPKGLLNICYKVMSLNTHRVTDICVGYSLTQILLKMQKYTPYSIEELQDKYNKNDNPKEFIPESILKKLQLEEKKWIITGY